MATILRFPLVGISIAAKQTAIVILQLGLLFDAGIYLELSVPLLYIFISHTHCDHTQALPEYVIKSKTKLTIFCPEPSVRYIVDLITLYTDKEFTIIPVSLGKNEYIQLGSTRFCVEPIQCTHSIVSYGYGFSEITSEGTFIPRLCYLLDTDHNILYDSAIEKYPQVIIECTYILESDIENALRNKHMSWHFLKPYVSSHPETKFILTHFSDKYGSPQIKRFFDKQDLKNITMFTGNHENPIIKTQHRISVFRAWNFEVYKLKNKFICKLVELDMQFEAGITIDKHSPYILLSDTSYDKIAKLHTYCIRDIKNIILHSSHSDHIDRILCTEMASTTHSEDFRKNWDIINDESRIPFVKGDINIIIEFIRIPDYHMIGFCVVERKQKLKSEFRRLPQEKINELVREKPEEVLEISFVNHFCYVVGFPTITEDILVKNKYIVIDVDSDERSRFVQELASRYIDTIFMVIVLGEYRLEHKDNIIIL